MEFAIKRLDYNWKGHKTSTVVLNVYKNYLSYRDNKCI
jgi:hypothetical protein